MDGVRNRLFDQKKHDIPGGGLTISRACSAFGLSIRKKAHYFDNSLIDVIQTTQKTVRNYHQWSKVS
jgi:hypothetical protein